MLPSAPLHVPVCEVPRRGAGRTGAAYPPQQAASGEGALLLWNGALHPHAHHTAEEAGGAPATAELSPHEVAGDTEGGRYGPMAHTPTIPPVRDTSATTRARTHSPATGSRTARLARRTGAAGAHAAGTHMPLPGHPTACVSEPESFEKSFEKPLPLHIHSLTNAPRPT